MTANNNQRSNQSTHFTRDDESALQGGQVDRSEYESAPRDEEKGLVNREEYEQGEQEVDDSEGDKEDENAKNNS